MLNTVFPADDEDNTDVLGSGEENVRTNVGNLTTTAATTKLYNIDGMPGKLYVNEATTTGYPVISESDLFPNYTASKTILAVVTVIAILAVVLFALATLRYRFNHKGSYYVTEFAEAQKLKKNSSIKMVNIHEVPSTKEWLL
uniref:Uncharacterized protein n=1 Tax=Ciona savignyi TaxID=51511 RepID=H2Z6C0_CIOSA